MTTSMNAATGALGGTEPRARFRDLVAAEWIKLRSLRSTWITYGTTALAVIGLNAAIAYDTYSHWKQDDRADFIRDGIPLLEAFTANSALIMMLAIGTLGALMIISEYSTGTIRPTLAAVPARRSVMAAKVAVLTAVTTAFGAFVAAASFGLTQAILNGRDLGVSIAHPGAVQVVLASALLAPVCALTGMALGAVIRQTATGRRSSRTPRPTARGSDSRRPTPTQPPSPGPPQEPGPATRCGYSPRPPSPSPACTDATNKPPRPAVPGRPVPAGQPGLRNRPGRRHRRNHPATQLTAHLRWASTLMTVPPGSWTKKRRTPQDSFVSG